MLKRILEKWFGLEAETCPVCEVLRMQLDESTRERKELLQRVLVPSPEPPVAPSAEDFKPIKPQFIPWRVRQQMLEAEDRKTAALMRDKSAEINKLEKELGVTEAGTSNAR